MLGSSTRWTSPPTARAMNQTAVIGPNQAATAAVPRLCTLNSPTRIARLNGMT